MAKCQHHSDREAVATCSSCGDPVCAQCLTRDVQPPLCVDCSVRPRPAEDEIKAPVEPDPKMPPMPSVEKPGKPKIETPPQRRAAGKPEMAEDW